jgi:hypothetical protein
MFDSLIAAKILENTSNAIEDTIQTKEFKTFEIDIQEDVSDTMIENLLQSIEESHEKIKETFVVDKSESGRLDMLLKGIIYQIKLLYDEHLKQLNHDIFTDPRTMDFVTPPSMEKRIDLFYDTIISNAALWCKCYEADDRDHQMCREILHKDAKSSLNYQHNLDTNTYEYIKEEVALFLKTYQNKKTDTDSFGTKELFENSKTILNNTLKQAEKSIDFFVQNNKIFPSSESLHKEYKNLFANSRDRFKSSRKTSAFLKELRKANMHYIMYSNNTIIYPFLFDLIVMSFVYSVTYKYYEKEFNDIQSFAKIINEKKEKYLLKKSDENYYYYELIRSVEAIPPEYKLLKPSIIIMKHYSEVLDIKYTSMANIFRQLNFEFADSRKAEYSLPKELISKKLDFDRDFFRKLSLYVQ